MNITVGVYRVWSGLCDLRTDHTLPDIEVEEYLSILGGILAAG